MATTIEIGVLAVNMPKSMAEQVRALAERKDVSVKTLIRWALREYIEAHEHEPVTPVG